MYAAWGIGSEMNEDDADDIALMAKEKLELEPDSDSEENEGESILGVSKITKEVLEDVPCEGEYFGDPIVEQSSIFRLNLGHLVRGKQWETPLSNLVLLLGFI
ncbi:hypothetical protein H5410_006571 [Solanum commersonii]|uniref:Uncharacterized protein n=1 Tax=Solanum commersonii TaxID=4109 RepID=A0A9J6AA54_SOLCO|nr:hypothetical protein H5410_006571 [Solanum commersonii]